MFCDVSLRLWMFRAKYDIIILAKAVGERPRETLDDEAFAGQNL